MIRDLALLIALNFQLSWNNFLRMKLWQKVFNIVALGLFGLGVGFASGWAGQGLGWLLNHYPQYRLEPLLPGLMLTTIAGMLLISSFGLALGSLFFSRDLELLMVAPVNRRAVFISKVLGGVGSYYLLVFLISGPALVTYGIALNYGPLYYLFILLAILGTPLLPAGLGALAVLLVARVAPARRVREVLGLVAALFGSSCALIGNTSQYWLRQFNPTNGATIDSLLAWVRSISDLPLPSMWAGSGLIAAGKGDWWSALSLTAGFWLITFGFFAGCIWLADRMYATGWMRMQGAGEAKRKPRAQSAKNGDLLARAAPFFALALKDWRIIPRDLRNFAQFLSPLFMIPLVYFQLFVNTSARTGRSLAQTFNQWGDTFAQGGGDLSNVVLAGTILMSTVFVFARIAQTGISMEGRSYWILKTAPISPRELLLGKFVAALVPFTILSTLLLIVAAFVRGFSLLGLLYGWFGNMLLGAGMLAMDVGLAVPWANLEWDDPRKMHSGWGGLIALVGYVLIAGLGGLALTLPYLAATFVPFLAPVAWFLGPFLAVGFTGCVAGAALWLGLSRIHKVGG